MIRIESIRSLRLKNAGESIVASFVTHSHGVRT